MEKKKNLRICSVTICSTLNYIGTLSPTLLYLKG